MLNASFLVFLSSTLLANRVNGHPLSILCSEGTNGAKPYPVLCNLYYTCENGDPTVHVCKPGMHFDPILSECNSPELTSFHLKHCSKSAGVLPHPQNCTQFVKCDDNNTRLENCEPGTVFNIERSSCDDIRNVPDCNELIGNENLRSDVNRLLQKSISVHIPEFIEDRRLISKDINSNKTGANNNLVDSTKLQGRKRNIMKRNQTLGAHGIVNNLIIRPRNRIKVGKFLSTSTRKSNLKRRKNKNNDIINDSVKNINLSSQEKNTSIIELDPFKSFFVKEGIDIISFLRESLNKKTSLRVPNEKPNTIFYDPGDVEGSRIRVDNKNEDEDKDGSLKQTLVDIGYLILIAPYSISIVGRNKTDDIISKTTEQTTIHSKNIEATTLSSPSLESESEEEEKQISSMTFLEVKSTTASILQMETGSTNHGDSGITEVLSGRTETNTQTIMDPISILAVKNIEATHTTLENPEVTAIPGVGTKFLSSTTTIATPTSTEANTLTSEESTSVSTINDIVIFSTIPKNAELAATSALTEFSTSTLATVQGEDPDPKTESQSHDILSTTSATLKIHNNNDEALSISE